MANETRVFRIPPNMPVQAVASLSIIICVPTRDYRYRGLPTERSACSSAVRKRMAGKRYQACALRRLYRSHVQRRIT